MTTAAAADSSVVIVVVGHFVALEFENVCGVVEVSRLEFRI